MKINKLVRNKIPEIIANEGKKATFRVLTNSEYIEYLEKKLDEEVAEFHESKDIEELADIGEVVLAIASAKGVSHNVMNDVTLKKRSSRGSFSDRILLMDVEEE